MSFVKPDPGWSLNDIENSLRRIASNAGASLLVKKDYISKRKGAMHDASRLQMLTTWARSANEKCLHFSSENSKDKVLEELCDYAPGIAALRLCEEVAIGDEKVRRRDALARAIKKMEASDRFKLGDMISGRVIDLVCVSGAKVQYLAPLFSSRSKNAVKGLREMRDVIELIMHYISKIKKEDRIETYDRITQPLAIFISELMKNTQEHATRDHSGSVYVEHVEGMILSWDKMPEDLYKQDFEKDSRLLRFWEDDKFSYGSDGKRCLQCWQLSFFDTGPGFASRITGKALSCLSVEEEREALLRCFKKNASTKPEVGAGNGLPGVLNALQGVGGLIKIRTGRMSIFNSFFPGEKHDIFDFVDWPNEGEELAPAEGAVISILVPFRGRA